MNLDPTPSEGFQVTTFFRAGFHFFAALHFWFSCFYDWFYVNVPVQISSIHANNKFKSLTYWDAFLQAIFFTVCFINDILGSNSKTLDDIKDKSLLYLRKFQDTLVCCLAFPLSMFVGLTFWGLYLVDRELVLPQAVDAYFPWWLNHFMHTNILIFALLEMYSNKRQYPPRMFGLAVLILFMLAYLAWLHFINYKTGVWVYPVLKVLGLRDRIIFFVGLLLFVTILYMLGERINKNIWGVDIIRVQTVTTMRTLKMD